MGKVLIFCRIQLKIRFWLHTKRWHTSLKFQLEIRSNKNVIAKKPLTNLYEMSMNSECNTNEQKITETANYLSFPFTLLHVQTSGIIGWLCGWLQVHSFHFSHDEHFKTHFSQMSIQDFDITKSFSCLAQSFEVRGVHNQSILFPVPSSYIYILPKCDIFHGNVIRNDVF